MEQDTYSPHEIVKIAAQAQVDPKTVRRHLVLGLPVRALTRERIARAIAKIQKAMR